MIISFFSKEFVLELSLGQLSDFHVSLPECNTKSYFVSLMKVNFQARDGFCRKAVKGASITWKKIGNKLVPKKIHTMHARWPHILRMNVLCQKKVLRINVCGQNMYFFCTHMKFMAQQHNSRLSFVSVE
jgi:hypothetical protein